MADSFSPNRGLILMQTGGDIGTWGTNLNNDAISIIDNNLGSNLTLSVAGGVDVTLSSTQAENLYYNFTGVLTGNINVIWPTGAGFYIVANNTTGAFTLTIKPTGGTGIVIAQGSVQEVFISTNTGTAFVTNNIFATSISPTFTGTISGVNETLSGTLAVTGNTTLTGTLGVTGNISGVNETLSGTLGVTGTISGVNETLSGTLGVTGTTTLGELNATSIDSTPIGGTTPSTAVFTSINGGQLAGLRNRIINGNMRIDQRNSGGSQTIVANTSVYTIDRFITLCMGANVTGQQVGPDAGNQYVYQFTGAASVTNIIFGQRIESSNIYDLASTTVTLSANLSNSLLTTVTWSAYYANAADNWSGETLISSGTFTVTSTLTRYSTQISLPANAINGIVVLFTVGAQISGTFVIGQVQLEKGSTATPFEVIPIGMDLDLCQRYYEILTFTSLGQSAHSAFCQGYIQIFYWYFKHTKRVVPTLSVVSGSWVGTTPTLTSAVDNAQAYAPAVSFYLNGTSGNTALSASAEL